MDHFILLFFIIILITGFSASLITLIIYSIHKKPVLLTYSLFLFSLDIMFIQFVLIAYRSAANFHPPETIETLSIVIASVGGMLHIVVSPYFFHYLLGIEISKRKTMFFAGLDIGVLACLVLFWITRETAFFTLFFQPVLITLILYGFYLAFTNIKTISDKTLRKSIKVFFMFSGGFFPYLVLDFFDRQIFGDRFVPYGLMAFPIFLLLLNILSIVFAFIYLNRPAYIRAGILTQYFREKFFITKRETEIIELILKGQSNRSISEKLFISYKTVENHVYNIYQKTDIKNRIELFNLILANQAK